MKVFNDINYRVSRPSTWQGRIDGEDWALMRWHQLIEYVDLREQVDLQDAIVFLGFCCDEGVRRNLGRAGAKDSPAAFRKVLSSLPVYFSERQRIVDAGDVFCDDQDLERAQFVLSEAVAKILSCGGFPIILGGGHEVTYGHYNGVKKHVAPKKIGIINLDAHLDIRPTAGGKGNSGTGFYQIAADCEYAHSDFKYLAIGIQKISNTNALFDYAKQKEVNIIMDGDFRSMKIEQICAVITRFAEEFDHIYLTIDMDVFAAPYAPGVSALAYNGLVPDELFYSVFSTICSLPNLTSVDFAELNPVYDIDNRTAKLAASLIFNLVNQRK